ncbi:HAMP domain-containing sensor histidine kinase [Roseateles asaccharophilus]|uniref:histidine kinase n=1 Tax=Roseateles asaccharophilus TaxID=582607 RepID=A0ABU2A4C7_9BURK|nr:HAMP domain-containing sensor histidine kinase [Roseateles asaccharophilus]MDR7331960.1 two-component system sensor histidine kinase GlrK [Roseateles asaccharophilus]
MTAIPGAPPARAAGLRGLSFHQCLLAAFLLITALLGGAAVQAMFALEHVATQGRQASQDAAGLTTQVQRLAERTVAMERSARQFLVLDDAGLRDRFRAAWQDAQATQGELAPLLADAASRQLFADWAAQAESAWAVLQVPARARPQALRRLTPLFARLHAINEALTAQSQQAMDKRSDAVLAELEQQWRLISALVLGAIALAVLLGLSFGHWLLRPLVHLEAAIGRLGDNRFDQPVQVRGPADLRRLGRQLEWLRQRLATLESDKTRFVRHISHELKTPMASIREGAALLRDGVAGPLTPDQAEIVRILGDNTAALQGQIEDLLRYQALASDSQQLQRRAVDLPALLARVVDDQRLLWQAKALQLRVEAQPCTARVDGDKLAIVLANLLGNAVRFSPAGGVVRWVLQNDDRLLRIACIDEGPGVAPEDVERVFDPFYQGRHQAPGARRGSGIGLSIVREIVQAHGGSCRLLPAERGAHFLIEIPHEKTD